LISIESSIFQVIVQPQALSFDSGNIIKMHAPVHKGLKNQYDEIHTWPHNTYFNYIRDTKPT